MGALTVNRKRCFVDIQSPKPFPLASDFSSTDDGLVSKRLKFSSPSRSVHFSEFAEEEAKREKMMDDCNVTIVNQMKFPQQTPMRRRILGPQRNIRVFGIGNPDLKRDLWMEPVKIASTPTSLNSTKYQSTTMRSLSSRMEKTSLICSLWRSSRKGKSPVVDEGHDLDEKDGNFEDRPDGELKLEDYKRLVEEVEDDLSSRSIPSFPIVPKEIIDRSKQQILEKNVEIEKSDMVLDLTQVSEDDKFTNTLPSMPLYKGLLEETTRKYDTKLNDLMFEVKLNEEKRSKFHIPKVEKPKEDILAPFTPLTVEEEDEVKCALQFRTRSCSDDVLVIHGPSNMKITREIMQCLQYGAWLNDEVINLYLELLKEREKREPKKFLKCHFFNTFFYKKLTGGRSRYDYKSVRRWTTQRKLGYSLADCDRIFVPIHKEIHWCLSMINVKDKKIQYLDSLGSMDSEVVAILAKYLTDELKDKGNDPVDIKVWKEEFVNSQPLQKNGFDCGMFMLKSIDFYSRGLGLKFSQENMKYFRKRMVKELLSLRAD